MGGTGAWDWGACTIETSANASSAHHFEADIVEHHIDRAPYREINFRQSSGIRPRNGKLVDILIRIDDRFRRRVAVAAADAVFARNDIRSGRHGQPVAQNLTIESLGLRNTFWVLVLPSLMNAWNVLIFKQFFEGIPKEMEEAAEVDGVSDLQMFYKIDYQQNGDV